MENCMLLGYPILVSMMVVTVEVTSVLMMSCVGRVGSVETLASWRWQSFRCLWLSRTLMRMRCSDMFHKLRLIVKVSFASIEFTGNMESILVASKKMMRYHTKCMKLNLSATYLDGGNARTST